MTLELHFMPLQTVHLRRRNAIAGVAVNAKSKRIWLVYSIAVVVCRCIFLWINAFYLRVSIWSWFIHLFPTDHMFLAFWANCSLWRSLRYSSPESLVQSQSRTVKCCTNCEQCVRAARECEFYGLPGFAQVPLRRYASNVVMGISQNGLVSSLTGFSDAQTCGRC